MGCPPSNHVIKNVSVISVASPIGIKTGNFPGNQSRLLPVTSRCYKYNSIAMQRWFKLQLEFVPFLLCYQSIGWVDVQN